jgi:uncharacterized protein YciI
MTTFAVIRQAGPRWGDGGVNAQPHLDEHAAFMNALAGQGFLLLAGPLAGTEDARVRVLLIINAESQVDVHRRLADDPWETSGQLVTESVEPWTTLVGTERLASTDRAEAHSPS